MESKKNKYKITQSAILGFAFDKTNNKYATSS
jgi:hypothetical protein